MKGLVFKLLSFGCFVIYNGQWDPTHLSKFPPSYFLESSIHHHLLPILWHEPFPWPHASTLVPSTLP